MPTQNSRLPNLHWASGRNNFARKRRVGVKHSSSKKHPTPAQEAAEIQASSSASRCIASNLAEAAPPAGSGASQGCAGMHCNKPHAGRLLRGGAARKEPAEAAAGDDGPMEGDKDEAALPDQGSPPADRPFPFPTWEESSGDENVLVIHSQVEEEEHKCLVCGESFPQQLSLLRHQKQQHAGERAFVCPECGRGFSLKHNLIIHQRIHTGEKPFGCSVCGKRFSLKQNLLTHQRVHSRERPFSCPACGKSFREQRLLLAHQKGDCGTSVTETQGEPGQQRMHTRGRARAERERGESLVQRPLRVKPQEKPHQNGAVFQCRQCGANFSCKSGLLGHQRIHREERPLQNDEGRRRCSPRETPPPPSQRRLAGDDPFQCLTCGKSFSQKGSLTAHRKCHLGEEMLS